MSALPRTVVLVTGGSGLVGRGIRAVVEEAAAAAAAAAAATASGGAAAPAPPPLWPAEGTDFVFVGSRDADLRDAAATRALFERVRPTHVVHAAAAVGGLFKNLRCPVELGRENVLMNDAVMEASRALGCKLILFLSTCIFPDRVAYPITEAALHEGPPHASNAAYAHAKRFAEVMARAYRAEYGCRFSCVVPTNVYGPHDNFGLEDAHVIPALVHRALLAKRGGAGARFVVAGSGAPLRQFVHSRDLARLALFALFRFDEAEPLILSVGAEAEVSIRRVAELVAAATGLAPGQLEFDPSRADGQHRKTASNAKLLRLLEAAGGAGGAGAGAGTGAAGAGAGFTFTPIEEGIAETVKWFEENFDSARK